MSNDWNYIDMSIVKYIIEEIAEPLIYISATFHSKHVHFLRR